MLKYSFDFTESPEGWAAGFADYDLQHPDSYRLEHGFRERPSSVGPGGSLYISGMNRSDDLFMYHKRKVDGLRPNAPYRAMFRVALASKYISESGSGGDAALVAVNPKLSCGQTPLPRRGSAEASASRVPEFYLKSQRGRGRTSVCASFTAFITPPPGFTSNITIKATRSA